MAQDDITSNFLTILTGWKFADTEVEQQTPPSAAYVPQTDDDAAFVINGSFWGQQKYLYGLDSFFGSEYDLVTKYRELSKRPPVDAAVTDIVNEMITSDSANKPVNINTDDLDQLGLSPEVIEAIREEFDNVLTLLDFNTNCKKIARKWYVDGRMSYLKIIDTAQPELGLTELRYIPAISIKKVREEKTVRTPEGIDITAGYTEYFLYGKNLGQKPAQGQSGNNAVMAQDSAIKLTSDSICYVTSGLYDESTNIIYSYLHNALKPSNQLKMIEDAVLIYFLARAPQRRIFYIDCGNLPRIKAEEHMKSVMNRFKNRMVYDASTGTMKDDSHQMSMTEDFYLPRLNGNAATEIGTLDGQMMGGQIDLLQYYQKLLYQALYVPLARLTGDVPGGFSLGRTTDVTREEIRFSKFIDTLRGEFNNLFKDLLRTQLLLKKVLTKNEWESIKQRIRFDYYSDNNFKELCELDLLKERLNAFEMFQPLIGVAYSLDTAKHKTLQMTDEEIKIENQKMAEEAAMLAQQQAEMGGGPSDDTQDDSDMKPVDDPKKK